MESTEASQFFEVYQIWKTYLKTNCLEIYNKLKECKLMNQEFTIQVLGNLENVIKQGCILFYLANLIKKGKSLNRLRKNIKFIKEFFENIDYAAYINIMKSYIISYSAFCIWSKVSRFIILKELKCKNEILEPALNEIKLKLKSSLKKFYKYLNHKKIIKYLSVCLELARFNIIFKAEINQLLIYSVKYLESRYLNQNYFKEQKPISTLDLDYIRLLHALITELKPFINISNFINEYSQWIDAYLMDIQNPEGIVLQLFPAKISRKSYLNNFDNSKVGKLVFRYIYNQIDIYLNEFSHLDSIFNIKYILNPTNELKDSFKSEIKTLKLIRRHLKGSSSLPQLISYSIQENIIFMSFDSHPTNLYSYLLDLKSSNSLISHFTLLKWAKSLIKSFYFLENHQIIHGNLNPQNLFINSDFELKLYNFSNPIHYQNFYSNTTFPCLPSYYLNPDHINQTSKEDVFALGLILLQALILEDLSIYISSELSLKAKLSSIQDAPLLELLSHMLEFDPSSRPTFSKLFSSISSLH